jgi:peptide/nickel transport system substrate-binding protein
LLKRDNYGKIIPGIAEIEISDDKKKYTIKIKENIFFSNGQKLTSDDVIFTINKINDPELNSPYYGNWFGVKYEKINERELKIELPQEYNQFKEILASFYVLPKNL